MGQDADDLAESTLDASIPGDGEDVVVAIAGLRSVREPVRLPLSRLNLICGRNGSGKSTVVDSLLMLKQSALAWTLDGPLLTQGPFSNSGPASELPHRGAGRGLHFGFGLRSQPHIHAVCRRVDIGSTGVAVLDSVRYFDNGDRCVVRPGGPERSEIPASMTHVAANFEPRERCRVEPDRFFLQSRISAPEGDPTGARSFSPHYLDAVQLGFLKTIRAVTRRLPAEGSRGPWSLDIVPFQDRIGEAILEWQEGSGEQREDVQRWLSRLEQTDLVAVAQQGERLDIQIGRRARANGQADLIPLRQAAEGTRRVLPVLAALASARRIETRRVIFLEEPEANLHALAQARLGELLAELAATEEGLILTVETHSAQLLRAVQIQVAAGALPAEHVRFHWFTRDGEGATRVKTVQPDPFGRWRSSGEDIAPVSYELDRAWFMTEIPNLA
jgi:energy-coupling factor transporter ATP-binding protein EcfA2